MTGALVVAFSGGKDSTAMAYGLADRGEAFSLLFTPTGDELPALYAHVERVVADLGAPLICPPTRSLLEWIDEYGALPNWRQRWCTRLIKIVPCIAWLKANPGSVLAVGLRADEEERTGLYGDFATYRYPLREWGMTIDDVRRFVRDRGLQVPERTDCALCYGQRLVEWWSLWREHPDRFAQGEALEARTGHTFRSPGRDSWPASLAELRARFEAGHRPPGASRRLQISIDDDSAEACRVCRF